MKSNDMILLTALGIGAYMLFKNQGIDSGTQTISTSSLTTPTSSAGNDDTATLPTEEAVIITIPTAKEISTASNIVKKAIANPSVTTTQKKYLASLTTASASTIAHLGSVAVSPTSTYRV